ncbi:MAG: hypothetical protein NVS2B16_32310 [Chloroflexota bacterium]
MAIPRCSARRRDIHCGLVVAPARRASIYGMFDFRVASSYQWRKREDNYVTTAPHAHSHR